MMFGERTLEERLAGICQVLQLRIGEARAALAWLEQFQPAETATTEALHAYKIARVLELGLTIEATQRRYEQVLDMIENGIPSDTDVINLDDFR